jgi:hypothetical protein
MSHSAPSKITSKAALMIFRALEVFGQTRMTGVSVKSVRQGRKYTTVEQSEPESVREFAESSWLLKEASKYRIRCSRREQRYRELPP